MRIGKHLAAAILVLLVLAACTPAEPDGDPAPEASPVAQISYDVFPPTVRFGDSPKGWLRNTGEVSLEYHHGFLLETFEKGSWQKVRASLYPEDRCERPARGLVLHPGDSMNERIIACGLRGEAHALPMGRYRVTKTVLTLPSAANEEPVEIAKTVGFEVGPPIAGVPKPSQCEVICISDTRVEPGQAVQVTLDPPRTYSWGALAYLHEGSEETIYPIAYLVAYYDRGDKMRTFWPGEGGGVDDIGWIGPDRWNWVIPRRLKPGIYSIVKEGLTVKGKPGEHEHTTWTVTFEVTS